MGFGLSQWPIFHWWEVWEPFLEEIRPEVVVIQTGIWDVQAVYGGERRLPRPEDPDWEAQYAFLVGVALDVLTADGAHVYWLTMLPSPEVGQPERLNRLLGPSGGPWPAHIPCPPIYSARFRWTIHGGGTRDGNPRRAT
jgi:hypothetical protein